MTVLTRVKRGKSLGRFQYINAQRTAVNKLPLGIYFLTHERKNKNFRLSHNPRDHLIIFQEL